MPESSLLQRLSEPPRSPFLPIPNSYALLAGLLGLGWALIPGVRDYLARVAWRNSPAQTRSISWLFNRAPISRGFRFPGASSCH